ncbi:MAG: flagellar type III secretion system protein FlhB [Planctomycetota bacterium]|nr:flagellar type III secretion system protein FlhB [Planctomycetota bacterium]
MADGPAKDERTEEATPRKLEQAREKGQVAYSTESVAAMGLLVAIGTFLMGGGFVAQRIAGILARSPEMAMTMGLGTFENAGVARIIGDIAKESLLPILILVTPMTVAGLLIGAAQAGLKFSPKAIALDLSKLNPIKGMERMVGMRGWIKVGLAALKIVTIGTVFGVTGYMQVANLLSMGMTDIGPMLAALGQTLMYCLAAVMVVVLLLALIDFLFQRFQFNKEQRMTKQEVKEEMKSQEGDPHLKARIRAVQREMASRRMMEDVKDAEVVVTNPTHYAVAISYPRDEQGNPQLMAPIVVAKGIDHLAQRIKKVAVDSGVPLYEDRPLARGMYAQVEIGEPIPADLYAAMATVLAHVYRTKQKPTPRLATASSSQVQ